MKEAIKHEIEMPEKDRILDKLDLAILAFNDEDSDLSLSERFSMMRRAWMNNAFETMMFIKVNGSKNPISEDKKYIQEEGIKQFGIMEKMYNMELKAGEKSGKKQEDVDQDWLKRIRDSKSTIANVVTDMKVAI